MDKNTEEYIAGIEAKIEDLIKDRPELQQYQTYILLSLAGLDKQEDRLMFLTTLLREKTIELATVTQKLSGNWKDLAERLNKALK